MDNRTLPILFNTKMVQAILEGGKTATRRIAKKIPVETYMVEEIQPFDAGEKEFKCYLGGFMQDISAAGDGSCIITPPFQPGDILYVRETWQYLYELDGNEQIIEETGRYYYAATDTLPFDAYVDSAGITHRYAPWHPSIHMPKEAARIWLRVTDVKAEKLQSMTLDDFLNEGVSVPCEAFNDPENAYMQGKNIFVHIWNSTVDKQLNLYGWDANPWVWAIEFERCEKP